MNNHHFCKALLSSARVEAKKHGLEVPKGLSCAYHAKATWIMAQLERD